MTLPNPEIEKRDLAREYRRLLRAAEQSKGKEDRKRIRKAWELAVEAHKDMRRASGEAYIFHPIAVARICAEEMGLDTTSIVVRFSTTPWRIPGSRWMTWSGCSASGSGPSSMD